MKITLVGPARPFRGGIAQFSNALGGALGNRGHDVRLITFRRQYPSFLFPGSSQIEFADAEVPDRTHALVDSINPISWFVSASRISVMNPGLVIFSYWLPFFAPPYMIMAWLLRRRGVRVMALVHNALPHGRHPGDALLSRLFFRMCDGLIVLSQAVRQEVERLDVRTPIVDAQHPTFDHFGPPQDRGDARTDRELPPDAPVLLFFGFIRRYKGLHVLIEAMPQIAEELPAVRLVVAGEFYEDEEAIRDSVVRLGLEEHVRFIDHYLHDDEVAGWFSACDLVVQPYVSATQSGVAQIAAAFGRPLVVTDVGGLAEAIPDGEAGLVVPPGDPTAVARAVVRYFRDPDLRARLERGISGRARQFSWEALCETIEAAATSQPQSS